VRQLKAWVNKSRQQTPQDLAGQRFGCVVAVRLLPSLGHGARWECRCDCGALVQRKANNLKKSTALTCACRKAGSNG
jgi:hypothetical protein